MFDSILGNGPIKAYLEKALKENCLPQTLLFSGPDGIGKSLFAKKVASHLLKSDNSPDLHLLAPEGKSGLYPIDTLREMMEKEHEAPFQAAGKVFILEDAERMQPASANALLKTLEEPSLDTTFILLTSQVKQILPTIVSRSAILTFQLLSEEEISSFLHRKGFSSRFAKLSHGSLGRALELATQSELEEHRKIVFSLLSQKPSYPHLTLELNRLEELMEKEENPVLRNRRIDYLLQSILMWHRDQHLKTLSARPELLFFPDEPKVPPTPLDRVEKAIERAKVAIERNMKLSVCLQIALSF